jgi:hypothetical protein
VIAAIAMRGTIAQAKNAAVTQDMVVRLKGTPL